MARLSRRGITLIELLITMAIMAIIAAAIMGTASAAMESARRSRTQTLVTRISQLLNDQLASYQTRRVDLSTAALNAVDAVAASNPADPTLRGRALADMRLLGLRELIKYEMPDRWNNVTENNVFLSARPASAQAMNRRYLQYSMNATPETVHQAAECLYLTVMLNTADGEARTLFSEQDIGDVDEDGAQEFIDGWGNPIAWVRWPAGFVQRSPLMSADPQADHDPNDMYRRDDPEATPLPAPYPTAPVNVRGYIERLRDQTPAFRLTPLVYSSGADGISDINTAGSASVMLDPIWLDPYALEMPLQPYHIQDNPFQFGTPVDNPDDPDGDDNFLDNIHNHMIDY